MTFSLRVKAFNTWQSSQNTLGKKKEAEIKLQAGGKPEKLAQVQQEIKDVRSYIDSKWVSYFNVSSPPSSNTHTCSGKSRWRRDRRTLMMSLKLSRERWRDLRSACNPSPPSQHMV